MAILKGKKYDFVMTGGSKSSGTVEYSHSSANCVQIAKDLESLSKAVSGK